MRTLTTTIMGGVAALALGAGVAVAASPPASAPVLAPQPSASRGLADRLAIQDLMARYEWALDAGDGKAYAALFAEDGVVVSQAGEQKGRAEIQAMIEGLVKRRGPSQPGKVWIQHILSNLVIDLHGDTADAKSFWTEIWNPKGPELGVRAAGHYEDKLVKRGGKWWFARRHIVDDIMPATPPA